MKNAKYSLTHWFGAISLIALLPLLAMQAGRYWLLPQMWCLPLSLVVIAIYMWRIPKVGYAASKTRRLSGLTLMLAGIALGLLASFLIAPSWAAFSGALICTGWLLLWLGIVPWTRVLALSSLLLFSTQPWVGWGSRVTSWLREQAFHALSGCLDQFGVFHFRNGRLLELPETQLDLGQLFSIANNFFLLVFVTLLMLVWFRSQLLSALLTLATTPLIAWGLETLYLLLVVWQVEAGAVEWLSGGALWGQIAAVVALKVACVVLASRGWVRLFEPLPISPAEASQTLSPQAIYNRVVIWPLRFALPTTDDQTFDPDDEAGPTMTTRALPERWATAEASDPWSELRWHPLIGSGVLLTLICGVAALAIDGVQPSQPSEWAATEESLERLEGVLPEGSVVGDVNVSDFTRQDDEDGRGVTYTWAIALEERGGLLLLRYSTDRYRPLSPQLRQAGWRVSEPPRLSQVSLDDQQWPVYNLQLEMDSGVRAHAWSTGVDSLGQPTARAESVADTLRELFEASVVGRLLFEPMASDVVQGHAIIETSEPLAADQRRAVAEMVASLTVDASHAVGRD